MKGELYSGLIREMHFIQFLEQIFDKLNIKDAESIRKICEKVIELKMNFDNALKKNDYNSLLLSNLKIIHQILFQHLIKVHLLFRLKHFLFL